MEIGFVYFEIAWNRQDYGKCEGYFSQELFSF